MARPRTPWRVRFARIQVIGPPDECWPWPGYVGSDGRGQFRIDRVVGAHIASHEFWIGPVPEGFDVDHVAARGCARGDCTNPAHLEAVPPEENRRRYIRGVCPFGHFRAGNRAPDGACRLCRAQQQRDRRARAKIVGLSVR